MSIVPVDHYPKSNALTSQSPIYPNPIMNPSLSHPDVSSFCQLHTLSAEWNSLLLTKYALDASIHLEQDRIQIIDNHTHYLNTTRYITLEQEYNATHNHLVQELYQTKQDLLQTQHRYERELDSILGAFNEVEPGPPNKVSPESVDDALKPLLTGLTYQLMKSNQVYLDNVGTRLQREVREEKEFIRQLKRQFQEEVELNHNTIWKVVDTNATGKKVLPRDNVDNLPTKEQMKAKMDQINKYKQRIEDLKATIRVSLPEDKPQLKAQLKECRVKIELAMEEFESMRSKRGHNSTRKFQFQ